MRPLSQTVKTSPSHGGDMGSIPVGVIGKGIATAMPFDFVIKVRVSRWKNEHI